MIRSIYFVLLAVVLTACSSSYSGTHPAPTPTDKVACTPDHLTCTISAATPSAPKCPNGKTVCIAPSPATVYVDQNDSSEVIAVSKTTKFIPTGKPNCYRKVVQWEAFDYGNDQEVTQAQMQSYYHTDYVQGSPAPMPTEWPHGYGNSVGAAVADLSRKLGQLR